MPTYIPKNDTNTTNKTTTNDTKTNVTNYVETIIDNLTDDNYTMIEKYIED